VSLGPSSRGVIRFEDICLTLLTSKPSSISASSISSAGVLEGRCLMTAFYRFLGFGVTREEREFFFLEEGLYG
jgi:hypothetical protein